MNKRHLDLVRLQRYGIIGLSTNLSLFVLFLLLIRVNIAPVWASGLCYVLGVILSYSLNRRWTFSSRQSHLHDIPRFLISYGIGFLITLALMAMLVTPLGPSAAQVITIGLTAVSIYGCLQLLHFGGKVTSTE